MCDTKDIVKREIKISKYKTRKSLQKNVFKSITEILPKITEREREATKWGKKMWIIKECCIKLIGDLTTLIENHLTPFNFDM